MGHVVGVYRITTSAWRGRSLGIKAQVQLGVRAAQQARLLLQHGYFQFVYALRRALIYFNQEALCKGCLFLMAEEHLGIS